MSQKHGDVLDRSPLYVATPSPPDSRAVGSPCSPQLLDIFPQSLSARCICISALAVVLMSISITHAPPSHPHTPSPQPGTGPQEPNHQAGNTLLRDTNCFSYTCVDFRGLALVSRSWSGTRFALSRGGHRPPPLSRASAYTDSKAAPAYNHTQATFLSF